MPRLARGEYLDPNEVQVVHAVQRCVRRAFLCGDRYLLVKRSIRSVRPAAPRQVPLRRRIHDGPEHRKVYILTDAERATQTDSNRFAAHILRQPQFRALAKARGWKPPYFGHWDGGYDGAPHKELPQSDMRAEFWVDAAGDAFAEAGGFLYLTTDQVRFFRPRDAREPIPLAAIAPRSVPQSVQN